VDLQSEDRLSLEFIVLSWISTHYPTVYVRHNYGTQYKWYLYRQGITVVGTDQAILANGIIAPGQAFWVQATACPAMSIAEAAKRRTALITAPVFRRVTL
jgi:hypothetical protein